MIGEHASPFFRDRSRSRYVYRSVLVTLIPLCLFAYLHYGFRPILLVLTGMLTAVGTECIGAVLMHRSAHLKDASGLAIGGLIGAMMSPTVPYWVPFAATIFAVAIVKLPFGGTSRVIFHPAAAGMAFATLVFREVIFVYPSITQTEYLPLGNLITDTVTTAASPVSLLQGGASGNYRWWELLIGQMPGPIGATAGLILLAAAAYLFLRRAASPLVFGSYIATCAVIALAFPRTETEWYTGLALELLSGYLLFAGVYLVSDSVTAPRYWLARIVYGALAGMVVMATRYFGQFEEGAAFAVLLVNPLATLLDRGCWKLVRLLRRGIPKGGRT